MTYFHARLTVKGRSQFDYVFDLSRERLEALIVEPYELGTPLVINGSSHNPRDLMKVEVRTTEQTAADLMRREETRDRNRYPVTVGKANYPSRIFAAANDVTNSIIVNPPGFRSKEHGMSTALERPTDNSVLPSETVFIVHGHDSPSFQESVSTVVHQATDCRPIILHKMANGGMTIIEKLERHTRDVNYAVVIFTADDEGKAKSATDLKPRARQNVILELGLLIGLVGRRRVAVLTEPEIEHPGDIDGLVYIATNDPEGWRNRLVREMREAGVPGASADRL